MRKLISQLFRNHILLSVFKSEHLIPYDCSLSLPTGFKNKKSEKVYIVQDKSFVNHSRRLTLWVSTFRRTVARGRADFCRLAPFYQRAILLGAPLLKFSRTNPVPTMYQPYTDQPCMEKAYCLPLPSYFAFLFSTDTSQGKLHLFGG